MVDFKRFFFLGAMPRKPDVSSGSPNSLVVELGFSYWNLGIGTDTNAKILVGCASAGIVVQLDSGKITRDPLTLEPIYKTKMPVHTFPDRVFGFEDKFAMSINSEMIDSVY